MEIRIQNPPKETMDALKERAKRNRRTIACEALYIIERQLKADKEKRENNNA